jgi:hypothetical protein
MEEMSSNTITQGARRRCGILSFANSSSGTVGWPILGRRYDLPPPSGNRWREGPLGEPHHVLSYDLGLATPDPEIFRTALRRVGRPPESCAFFDDVPTFVDAAAVLGINFRVQLSRLGLALQGEPHSKTGGAERRRRARSDGSCPHCGAAGAALSKTVRRYLLVSGCA